MVGSICTKVSETRLCISRAIFCCTPVDYLLNSKLFSFFGHSSRRTDNLARRYVHESFLLWSLQANIPLSRFLTGNLNCDRSYITQHEEVKQGKFFYLV